MGKNLGIPDRRIFLYAIGRADRPGGFVSGAGRSGKDIRSKRRHVYTSWNEVMDWDTILDQG